MDFEENKLEPPESFPFPFTPYVIQKDFMSNLYETLEDKKHGIFESPTGTGKSMSLICGSLAWLLDHKERIKNDLNREISSLMSSINGTFSEDNWLEAHAVQVKNKQKRDILQSYLNKIIKKEQKMENIRAHMNESINRKKYKKMKSQNYSSKENKINFDKSDIDKNENETLNDNDFILEDYSENKPCENFSGDDDSDNDSFDEEEYYGVKIIFCSRTHSQLNQLVHEIQKSPYNHLNISVISLSSRQIYCINENILKLKHLSLINEKCQDLHGKKQENVSKKSCEGEKLKKQKTMSSCPFYQLNNLEDVKLKILTEIIDVEDTVQLGKEFHGCPYYATRQSVPDADVILVPYNTILHKNTRQACGINLKDSVIIIDEAHNLLDAISNIHSCSITGFQLICSHSQLIQYRDKYHDRFTPYNLLYVNQLIFILKNFIQKLGGKCGEHPDLKISEENTTSLETLADFTLSSDIDTINIFRILEFASKSKIVHKLRGFTLKYKPSVIVHNKKEEKGISSFLKNLEPKMEEQISKDDEIANEGNPLMSVLGFLECLTNHNDDGRIVCTRSKTIRDSYMKFLLLNPASHFVDIVREARSVVLAGGTMDPISEFTDQLFLMAGSSPERIKTFSCDHVIGENSILPIIVPFGPTGKEFNFSYQNRQDSQLVEELGRLVLNVCSVVPAGIVCFFPSYEYESSIYQMFQNLKFIEKLEKKKKLFREPKKSNMVEEVLREYAKHAKRGAVLFSVVGGKLSEGLNFSDDLGRCVIVIGLPYPNAANPELKEKINYLNTKLHPNTGKEYYENLCMKAVNQSIGRSVRHINDYASVLLVDNRYSRSQCRGALPRWIQKSLCLETKFGSVIRLLAKFFNSKKCDRT